ncbi:MAG: FecR/PupR family sigma factor regulator, partial [Proteobacteria bacterium]|nr:FecR/PupR family sigma factor regulator [Pseudomonadota bacterium]
MSTAPPNAPTGTTSTGDHGQAEAWLARLHAPDCSARERAAFEDWLAQSPTHIEAWLDAERIDAMARTLASDDLLRAAARQARRKTAGGGPLRRWRPAAAALAATLVVDR